MKKLIALALWGCADGLEIMRGGLLAAAVSMLGKDTRRVDPYDDDQERFAYHYPES